MTKIEIKAVFSRFENLPLLNLRQSLVRGEVCVGDWWDKSDEGTKVFCPIAHGWRTFCGNLAYAVRDAGFVGADAESAAELFYNWFDGHHDDSSTPDRKSLVLDAVDDLLAERLADADAVQRVISGVPVEVNELCTA